MALLNDGEKKAIGGAASKISLNGFGPTRLARELFGGRYRPGQSLQLEKVGAEHGMDNDAILKAFA